MGKIAASLFWPARRSASVVWSIINGQLPAPHRMVRGSIVLILFLVSSLLFIATPRPAFADHASPVANPAAPSPQPCINAITTPYNKLTDNYITDENGKAAIFDQDVTVKDITPNTEGLVIVNENYVVDFSKLQGIFGATNSDFGEGGFQDLTHQQENINNLNSQDFNEYNGPAIKLSDETIIDEKRVKYVTYIYQHPHLPEASVKWTDNENKDPLTIYQMIAEKGFDNPPKPPPPGADEAVTSRWFETWGKYWSKFPTSYSEFYIGYLQFRVAAGEWSFDKIEKGVCPGTIGTQKEFIMPEFKRTVSISDQLNQIVVPCAAQSFRHGSGPNPEDPDNCFREYLAASSSQNKNASVLGKFIQACKDAINGASKTLIKQLRNATKTSFKILNPIKIAFAAPTPTPTPTPIPCFKKLTEGKEGNAPFCAFPEFNQDGYRQLDSSKGEQCVDSNNPNKLDKNNPNVKCIFNISWSQEFTARLDIPDDPEERLVTDFDKCEDDDKDGDLNCTIKVKVWPVFRIPFLAEIWNDTLYSNEEENGVVSPQLTGRPGIYSSFIPKAVSEILFPKQSGEEQVHDLIQKCTKGNSEEQQEACPKLNALIAEYNAAGCGFALSPNPDNPYEGFEKCLGKLLDKNLPGQVATDVLGAKSSVLGATSDNAKERFIGATDCAKVFTRDISLKPRALQKEQGLEEQKCNLQAKAPATGGGLPPGVVPLKPEDCSIVPPASDGNPVNGIETSVEELMCYIIAVAGNAIEPISGNPLVDEMLAVANLESGFDQCAVGGYGEIGIFQYTAETWSGATRALPNIDSGSGTYSNKPPVCWGTPGADPININDPADTRFDWSVQFGPNFDGGAWEPFRQIDEAKEDFLNTEACQKWSTYRLIHKDDGICP